MTGMTALKSLILSFFLTALALPLQAQEGLSLNQISAYLNSFKTARGAFTQVNDDGTRSTGRLYIKRPGRVRFEYDPPAQILVVSNGETVGVVDGKSNTRPEAYSLNRTPLKIILARRVNLKREKMVTGHDSDGVTTTVRAQDPEHPEYGSIDLVFDNATSRLQQWIINDSGGGRTTVRLEDLQTGMILKNDRFVIPGLENTEQNR